MARMTLDEETQFRDWVREGLDRVAPLARTRDLVEKGRRDDPTLWDGLAKLGVLGLLVDEEHGGAGAGPTALALFLAEAGRVLLPGGHLAGSAIAPWLLRADAAQAGELLARIAAGQTRVAFADVARVVVDGAGDRTLLTGTLPHVPDADVCDLLLVLTTDREVHLVDAVDTRIVRRPSLDETRPVCTVDLDRTPARRFRAGPDDVSQARALLALGLAAEGAGAMAHVLDATVEYVKVRRQFGRPIGQFQAVKHRCADMFVAVQASTAMVLGAFARIEESGRADEVVARATSAYVGDAFLSVAKAAMQLHGGIAFSWEHDLHLYVKRAKGNQILAGGADHDLASLADALLSSDESVLTLVGLPGPTW